MLLDGSGTCGLERSVKKEKKRQFNGEFTLSLSMMQPIRGCWYVQPETTSAPFLPPSRRATPICFYTIQEELVDMLQTQH